MRIKKIVCIFISAVVFTGVLTGCAKKEDGRLKVVCTLFPQYDFIRVIAGEKVNLKLLVTPGENPHDYVPLSEELNTAKTADLFIYTGDSMEAWVAAKMKSKTGNPDYILDVSDGITLNIDIDASEHTEKDETGPFYDPHFWTLPLNAEKMVETITARLCMLDTANTAFYRANADAYKTKLEALDTGFRDTVKNGKRKNIVIGDSFALGYFTKEYEMGYLATQDYCSPAAAPGEAVVTKLENSVKKQSLPVVFYRELSDQKTATTISTDTGAQMLLFHSCENITKEESNSGATYLSLMQQNLENLRVALG